MHLTPGVVHNLSNADLFLYRISAPYAQIDHRFLFQKGREQLCGFWTLVSAIDGSILL